MKKNGFIFSTLLFISCTTNALTLPCVVQHTLKTNPDVLQTIHNLEATNEQVKQARADYYPSIDVNAFYGRQDIKNVETNNEWLSLWRNQLGITLHQMLFDGFATRNNELRTMALTDASAFKVYAESEDIALAASETYINILRDKELIAIGEANVAEHERLAHMISRRAEQGVGRVSETYQAEGRLALARSNLIALRSQYNEDRIIFQRVTGLCPEGLECAPDLENIPSNECSALKTAVCFHPTLKAAIAEIEAARAQHRLSFAPNFPKIDLILSADNNHNVANPLADKNQAALVQVQWNLFRGGKDLARQRETAFNVMEAADIRDRTYRTVVQQTSLSWNAFVIAQEQMEPKYEHMTNAAKSASAYIKLFGVGRTSLFDLLDAQRERYSSAQEYIGNKYLKLVAKYRILNAMGQLNRSLCVNVSRHASPCYRTVECAGSRHLPFELDYPSLLGGCNKTAN